MVAQDSTGEGKNWGSGAKVQASAIGVADPQRRANERLRFAHSHEAHELKSLDVGADQYVLAVVQGHVSYIDALCSPAELRCHFEQGDRVTTPNAFDRGSQSSPTAPHDGHPLAGRCARHG